MKVTAWSLVAALLHTLADAHMQMANPYPIDSQYNPAVPESLKDYSYTSPLLADGSNFPCKGYQNQRPIMLTGSYVAGSSYVLTLYGSAVHGGGSCQISLSYDQGETFRVIKSMIGGCPLVLKYDFTIPSYAPSGVALLAWTWMNEIGNREYYMNCAWVQVSSQASSLSAMFGRNPLYREQTKRSPHHQSIAAALTTANSTLERREIFTSFDQLPFIWKANLPPENNCTTVEGIDPVFANPGPDVAYGNGLSASSAPSLDNNCDSAGPPGPAYSSIPLGSVGSGPTTQSISTLTSTSSSTSTTSSHQSKTKSSPGSPSVSTTTKTVSLITTITTALPCSMSPSPPATNPGNKGSKCNSSLPDQGLKCLRKGTGFAICDHGYWVDMGSVAYGTKCTGPPGKGVIVASNGG